MHSSDVWEGPGRRLASDGRWYAPHLHSECQAQPAEPAPIYPPGGGGVALQARPYGPLAATTTTSAGGAHFDATGSTSPGIAPVAVESDALSAIAARTQQALGT